MSHLAPRSDTTTPRNAAPWRAGALVLALASQLAALLHACGTASIAHASADSVTSVANVARRERVALPSPRDSVGIRVSDHALAARWNALLLTARDTTTSKSGPVMREARDLALFESPSHSRRARWFLWATSAVAVGAVIAVFAQPQDVDHPGPPELPAFPDAP